MTNSLACYREGYITEEGFMCVAPGDSLHNISLNAETKSIKTFDFFKISLNFPTCFVPKLEICGAQFFLTDTDKLLTDGQSDRSFAG